MPHLSNITSDTMVDHAAEDGVSKKADGASTEEGYGDPMEAPPQVVAKEEAGEDNKFQIAIAAWKAVNLTSLIPKLDGAATEVIGHQRDALTQRKDLAQKTKDFRRLDDSAKLTEIKGLLKAYQGFIDVLTNQSKSISSAFFLVYSPLSEAPDPYPLLEASIDALVTAEETVPRITEENQRLQGSLASLTRQLDDTEALLSQERSTRRSLELSQDSSIRAVETSWSAVLKEKEDNWVAKERALDEKVENQDRLLKELKASIEVSQRLGRENDTDDGGGGGSISSAELEIVSSELDRANVRLAEVEARNEQLRLELARSASQSKHSQVVTTEDDPLVRRLQSEKSSLLRKLETSRMERDSERGKWKLESRILEKDVASLKKEREVLVTKVQRWSDYDSVKQELDILKSIELSIGEDNDEDGVGTSELHTLNAQPSSRTPGNAKAAESLEQLLLARNKKLSNELTVLRVSHQELQVKLETLQANLSSADAELNDSRNLNAILENDLEQFQQKAANTIHPAAMSVAGALPSKYPQSVHGGRRGRASPTSSIISGFDPYGSLHASTESFRPGDGSLGVGTASGILPMITAQRDRFKKRNSELENDLSKSYQTVSSLRSEIASLQKDNLNLYEKTRYVSTFNRIPSSAVSSGHQASSSRAMISTSNESPSGLSLDRYRSTYEQNLSPFAAFRGRESARALKRMNLPERAVYQITRMVLATRTSRNLFAAYCVALHLLVLGMLYWIGGSDIERQASNLSESVVNPVADGVGQLDMEADVGDWIEEGFSGG